VSEPGRAVIPGIAAAILLVALVGVGLSLTVPLLSLEMERMGVSSTLIGLNTAVAGLASMLVVPFVPRLAARLGVGRVLALAIALVVLSLLAFRLLFDFRAWFAVRFVFSAALGALFVLSEYWIASLAPPARRGLVMGLYATVLALGFAIGPAVLGAVGTSGWPPYIAGALLLSLAALPLVLARRHLPALHDAPGRRLSAYVLALPVASVAGLSFGAIETGGFALLPLYGLRVSFGPESAALLVSVMALGNVLLQVPLGLLADRMDKGVLLALIALGGALGALLLPALAGPNLPFHALLLIWGGIAGGLYTVGLAYLASRFEGPDLAGANAAFVVLYNAGLTVGPPVVGAGMDVLPPHGFAYAIALFFGLVLAAALVRPARR
jgi:MFS family permease